VRSGCCWRSGFFVVLSFVVGDYVAPTSRRLAQLLKGRYQNGITVGQTGGLVEGKKSDSSYIVNVKSLTPTTPCRAFKFSVQRQGLIASTTQAPHWQLHGGNTSSFNSPH
jgi:lipopolysaccharide export system permease protein